MRLRLQFLEEELVDPHRRLPAIHLYAEVLVELPLLRPGVAIGLLSRLKVVYLVVECHCAPSFPASAWVAMPPWACVSPACSPTTSKSSSPP